jgi:hypothetical protein
MSQPTSTDPIATDPGAPERSVGDLTRDLSEQSAELVRSEIALAVAELKEKGRHAGAGAGPFRGARVVVFHAGGALVAAAILGLAELVDAWLAALIVGVVLLAIAGISALAGKKEVERATPIAPERTQTSVKADVEAVKQGIQH